MPFFARVASLATLTLACTILIGGAAPSFATELAPGHNVLSLTMVPTAIPPDATAPLPVPGPAIMVRPVPGALLAPAADDAVPAVSNTVAPTYRTLADAVAAQDGDPAADRDLACLAGAVFFEAQGEPLSGQLAVAEVILNRTRSGRFPQSICSVVTQPGQFSFIRGGQLPPPRSGAAYRTAIAVARVALADLWDSPAPAAIYFHARHVAPGWRLTQVAAIGNHIFYR